ncbi:hypothetical protein TNCV_3909531 [Trichonephila clavipes]|nr:hypothetical protein TNCV_3909531 [Trichonephila clavipes]
MADAYSVFAWVFILFRKILQNIECAGWVVGLVDLLYPRLQVRPQPKSVDFPNAENRQRLCRMIIRHEKDPLSIHLAWMICKIKFLSTNFTSAELRCLPLGKKLGVKITCGNWYRLNDAALKSDTSSWGMY